MCRVLVLLMSTALAVMQIAVFLAALTALALPLGVYIHALNWSKELG